VFEWHGGDTITNLSVTLNDPLLRAAMAGAKSDFDTE
jgi:hypothetical protein